MASKEPFLPVPTEEDAQMTHISVPTAANYNMNPPSAGTFSGSGSISQQTTYNSSYRSGNPQPMSFESSGENFSPEVMTGNQHTVCFNVCCDFRRAVIIVNGITIGIKILTMAGLAIVIHYVNDNIDDIEKDIDDDAIRKQVDEFVKSGGLTGYEWIFETIDTVSIGLHLCGIYGALMYKQWGVIVAGSLYALQVMVATFQGHFLVLLIGGMMLYPHIYMIKLMQEGIMTPHNYHRVATCCGDKQM